MRVLILENAYYSVISPEACSAILVEGSQTRRGSGRSPEADSGGLKELGVIDEVVAEPEGGAHRDHDLAAANLGSGVAPQPEARARDANRSALAERYAKFRKLGNFAEPTKKNGA